LKFEVGFGREIAEDDGNFEVDISNLQPEANFKLRTSNFKL
jgi:hypothetical protein